MKHWVFTKAERLYQSGSVRFKFTDREGNSYFSVLDEEADTEEHIVKIGDELDEYCDCMFGVTQSVNGKRCPHIVAVNLFIQRDIINGDLSKSYLLEGDSKNEDVDSEIEKDELSSQEKKELRSILSCELCGADDDLNLHRIKRKGPYVLRNVMPVCGDCHRKIHSKEKGHTNK